MASVNKRPNGKWEVRYLLNGKHKSKSFLKKKDADSFKRAVETEISSGNYQSVNDTITVKKVCEEWLREAEDRVKIGQIGDNSYANYCNSVDNHIVPAFGERRIFDIKPIDIEDWFRLQINKNGLLPRTARTHVYFFKQIVDFAIRRGYIKFDFIEPARKIMRGIKPAKVKTFTVDQVKLLLLEAEKPVPRSQPGPSFRSKCFLHLAAFCGLRWGEIQGLTLGSINFERKTIKVHTALGRHDKLKGPKTHSGNREVPMADHVAEMMKKWLAYYYVENDRGLVFRTEAGFKIQPANFYGTYWRPLLERAGLVVEGKGYHFHALRHFASSWWIANGMDLPTVATLMGHSKFDVTLQIYAHPVLPVTQQGEAIRRMAQRLLNADSGQPAPEVAGMLTCAPAAQAPLTI